MLSLLSILLRYKRVVVVITLAGFAVSALVSLVVPPRYRASAAFIPFGVEKEITGHRGFWAQMGSFGEKYASFLRSQRSLIVDYILRSRWMSKLMAERFDLEDVYDAGDSEEVRRRLQEHSSVRIRDEGVIVLIVEDREPQRAFAMVEAYIHYLDSLLVELSIKSAADRTRFLESEYAWREKRIASADSALSGFLARHGIYHLEQQARAALEVATLLNARLNILEVDKGLLEMTLKEESPELERLYHEIDKLKEQLMKITEGSEGSPELFPPLSEFPDLAVEYIRLITEVKAQEEVLAFIRLELEDSKITAHKKESVLRIIDPPFLPESRVWPKRKQMVIVSTIAVFFWTCFVLMFREKWREGAFGLGGLTSETGAGHGLSGSGSGEEGDFPT